MRYLIGFVFWGSVIIIGEVIKWKAAEQFNAIFKTLSLMVRCWLRGI